MRNHHSILLLLVRNWEQGVYGEPNIPVLTKYEKYTIAFSMKHEEIAALYSNMLYFRECWIYKNKSTF